MPVLFLKASGAPRKYANMPGYVKVKGHWVRANKEAKTPAGAPKAAHPEAHAKGKPYSMPEEHVSKLLYDQEKAAKNHEMKNFNEKHVPGLLAHAKEGDVTAILGSKFGTNTHAKKLVAIANHLLEQMGSTHKVSLGQQAGAHEGVSTHPKAKGEQPQAETGNAPQNAAEAAETPAEDKKALDAVADAVAQPMPEPEKPAETPKGSLAMPAFMSGKQSKGVRTAYEEHGQKIIDAVNANDIAALQALVNPNAGAWKGKTANSKMLLGMYAQGLAKLQKKGNRITPVAEEPSAVAAVETIVQTPAQPKPPRKAQKGNVAEIDWDSYLVPDNIKSAAGYNKQLAAVKTAAELGDVYGILSAKYGTNTYAKKVAAAANMALTKLGHPHLKVVLGKTAVHPLLESLPQPSEEAKETQAQIQQVQAKQEEGPKEGDTRMGKSGMLVFHDGHWHKQETDEPVSDKEANPKFKAGSKVTPSQMLDLPAGTIVQCFTKDGNTFHQFLIGHSKAWFIPPNGKPHKTPLGAGKYAGLMGLDQENYGGYTGGYHANDYPTTIVSVGAKGWMSEKMKAGLKVMYPGASSLTTPGIYPIFDGKMVIVTDLKNPTKGFAMDETGEWYILQNVSNGYNDEVYTKVMKGIDPGNDLSVQMGFAPDLTAPLAPTPDHPEPGIASLLHSVTMSIEGEQYAMADHFVMLAAEALKDGPGSEDSMNAMKWLIQAKGKAHEGASLAKPTIPDAPAPEVEPAKMKPLPDFKTADEFHAWSKTPEADKWLDEGEVFYGSSDAWNDSPEAKAWDAWAEKHTKEQEAKWAAEAKAKEDEKKAKPTPPGADTALVWEGEIAQIANAMETGNMGALKQIHGEFAGFASKAAKEVKAYAEAAIDWLKANGGGFDAANFHDLIGKESGLIKQRDKAIELGKQLGTEEGWQAAINFFSTYPTIAVKVAGEAIAQLGFPANTPRMPTFADPGAYESEVNQIVAASKYFDPEFAATFMAGLKKFYGDFTTPDGVKLNDFLHQYEAQITGKPMNQKEDDTAYDDLYKELLNEDGTPKEAPTAAVDTGPHEGDTKMGKDGMLILKDGHWVKMGAEDVPQPSFSGPKAEVLGKAVTKLMEAIAEHGPDAIKNVAKITEHKTGKKAGGMTLKFSNGGKYFVFKHSETPDFSNFAHYLQGVKDWANKKPKAKAAPQPAASASSASAPATSTDSGSINYEALPSVSTWEKVGGKKGSNEGESLKDENGQVWYVKYPKDEEHAQCEVLAASLYGALGLKSQDAQLVMNNGKLGIASRWIDGLKQGSPEQLASANGALDGFLADVWMANRDVVGMSYDNLQIDADGDAVRVDAGASFFYRAQGEKKLFGADPVELTSMLDPSKNHQTHSVFKNMTKADYFAAAAKLADLPDAKIRIMVAQMGPGSKGDRKRLAETLIARKAAILGKYPVDKHGKPAMALDPTKLSIDPDRLPKPHDFQNWNGEGKGLSSKDFLNKANEETEAQMLAVAKSGNLEALKAFQFDVINPSTGEKTGQKAPIENYPSKHVFAFYDDLVNLLNEIANPPVALKIFHEIDIDSIAEVDAAFPAKPFGTTVDAVAAQEKMGQWVALGRVAKKDLAKITPKKFMSYPQAAIAKAYDHYKQAAGKLAKAFILGIQADGQYYNGLFRQGKEFDNHGNKMSEVAQAALDFAVEQPEGTTLTRWQEMTPDMIKKILAAEDGTVISPIGSMCTSMSGTSTAHFGPNRITIRYAKGAKAVESFGSGGYQSEKEVTTLPGARFVILSKKMNDLPTKSVQGLDLELLMLPPDIGL